MTNLTRTLALAAVTSFAVASFAAVGPAFAADDAMMKKEHMDCSQISDAMKKKECMTKADEMKKDAMMKKDDMKKDTMMKKDEMKKEMK